MTEETEKPKRKKPSGSPTQRTLKVMRERGYHCAVVERWNPHAKLRVDLFGFIDVLCLGDGEVVGVQACSGAGGDPAARVRKITEHENVAAVRKAGIRILVQAWRKGRDGKYVLREIDVS